MKFTPLDIPDVILIEPRVFTDERGFFFESFNLNEFEKTIGLKPNFVQDNHSKSVKGVLRGLHYQRPPSAQGKLVRVIQGEVFDVAVDIRKGSPSYGAWVGTTLSAENKQQLWIPEGFAHGFITLSDSAEFVYKTTHYYSPADDASIRWDDPDIDIHWPGVSSPLISEKDQQAPLLVETDTVFSIAPPQEKNHEIR